MALSVISLRTGKSDLSILIIKSVIYGRLGCQLVFERIRINLKVEDDRFQGCARVGKERGHVLWTMQELLERLV